MTHPTLRLLRLEAINLSYVIDDTEDLSTRRGGGYMLLQVVREIEQEFKDSMEKVSTGASIGLFKINHGIDPKKLVQDIQDFLQTNDVYRHATFAIAIMQGEKEHFRTLVEQTISQVRWQQMQSLNFTTYWGESNEICKIDELRPAICKTNLPGDSEAKKVSQSIYDRRESGKALRQKFYQNELTEKIISQYQLLDLLTKDKEKKDGAFTNHTESLTQFSKDQHGYKKIPRNLNGKMAVFYADGNNFGKIQRRCTTIQSVDDWDNDLKEKRTILLAELLQFLQSTPLGSTNYNKDDNALRFETLLWGGDEVLFLLPAWLGLEFTERFFSATQDWKDINEEDLTHAAGLVFASHAAPISQLQKLAKKLADYGKATDKTQNTVSWIVLESFDHAGDNMDDYWQRSGIAQNGWQQLLLTQDKLRQLRQTLIPLKDVLPRSAIVRVLRSLSAGKAGEETKLLQRSYESVDAAIRETGEETDFTKLWELITHNAWQMTPDNIPPEDAVAWTMMMELWDYILHDVADHDQTGDAQ